MGGGDDTSVKGTRPQWEFGGMPSIEKFFCRFSKTSAKGATYQLEDISPEKNFFRLSKSSFSLV